MTARMFAVVCVLMLAAAGGVTAQLIVPTSQDRRVAGSAYAEDLDGSQSDSDADQALDFGLFDSAVSAQADVSNAIGSSGGIQDSEILANAINASGSCFANGEGWDFDAWGDGSGSSRMHVTFTLTADTDYVLQGQIAAYDDGGTDLSLRDAQGEIFGASAYGPAEEIPIDETGSLTAGEYTLEIDASGSAYGDFFTYGYASAEYMITFQVGGSGPGGEVPDGKDVPGGPPLQASKVAGGLVRLTWGASCRSGDTDYEVYEAPIGDLAGLIPVTCTTGGLREYDVNPSFLDAMFLAVPTDGVTEGSYGDSSDEFERDPSTSACRPRSLGAPVCP